MNGATQLAFLKWRDSDQKDAKCYRENIPLNCDQIYRMRAEHASRLAFEAGNKNGIMKTAHKIINFIHDYTTKGG